MDKKDELIALYAVYVETITANESRRQSTSSVYLSLIAAGIAVLGSVPTIDPLFIVVPVFVISCIWFSSVSYFRALSTAKFGVINEFEKSFVLKPFQLEWAMFKTKKHVGLAHLDMILPAILGFITLIYIVFRAFAALVN